MPAFNGACMLLRHIISLDACKMSVADNYYQVLFIEENVNKILYLPSALSLQKLSKSILIGMTAMVLMSCAEDTTQDHLSKQKSIQQQLLTKVVYGEHALTCDNEFIHHNILWQANSLGFFLSNFEMREEQSDTWKKISLEVNDWQTPDTALLWFVANCGAKEGFNKTLTLNLPLQDKQSFTNIAQLRFSMSVPFEVNHANPLTQPSPINLAEMFWSWRLGHKFFRIDMSTMDQPNKTAIWNFHLGSTGCSSASSLRAPVKECEQSNRNTYTVNVGDNASNLLMLDLKILLEGINANRETSCMFKAEQLSACNNLLSKLRHSSLFRIAAKKSKDLSNTSQESGQ
ncbi:MbnP family copper-binding protein [Glaciecola petra]|uniref:Metallo-mystery pair system four-Cys motif protein n=1 Tax=Glaciecola petra TaxID=3075602 RepID=A0ABU2ZV38_9ALTE|nr:MbnP family copper-binding protein [Aestuariibacter sp. P117]MDT0596126.1 metallo-mystery pair system four-Cys motif protein [Aestuariibacter sp. P117]